MMFIVVTLRVSRFTTRSAWLLVSAIYSLPGLIPRPPGSQKEAVAATPSCKPGLPSPRKLSVLVVVGSNLLILWL